MPFWAVGQFPQPWLTNPTIYHCDVTLHVAVFLALYYPAPGRCV